MVSDFVSINIIINMINMKEKKIKKDNNDFVNNEKYLKLGFRVFLTLGIITLINYFTHFVIYLMLGIYSDSAKDLESIAKIIVINNHITNIWYIWLLLATIFLFLIRKNKLSSNKII